jgi:hypothetical protein
MAGVRSAGNHENRKHPHADAEYWVYRLEDGTYGIKVTFPNALPTRITSFPSRAKANDWIEAHKKIVEKHTALAGQPMFGRRLGRKQVARD